MKLELKADEEICMVLITEAARPVVGYEGLYSVTKNGVIYSLPRRGRKLKIMNPVDNMKAGYLRIALSRDGHTKLCYIHRVVAEAYIPNIENKPMVNHINGIKTDNKVENLEWVTGQENRDHAFDLGLFPNQKIHSHRKGEVVELVKQGIPIRTVAEMYGMRPRGVDSLLRRYKESELKMAA
jgi:hypothetical protein